MRVGTLSLNINTDDLNYGAMLHSWAFQQVLQRISEVSATEIIDYTPDMLADFDRTRPVYSYLRQNRVRSAVKVALSGKTYQKRLKKFQDFQQKHMKVSQQHYTGKEIGLHTLPYDCLICESDVIWSPAFFSDILDPTFFLDFPSAKPLKKIIYAASMANANFTQNSLHDLKQYCQAPDSISCRETFATKIVEKYTGRKAEHVVDPVLLLRKEDYFPICAPCMINEPYLFLYIPLGYNEDYQKTAIRYAAEKHLKVIELSYFTWNRHSHCVFASAGIEEFLSLIKNAQVVFTNSFHAVCFSLLFQKDIYAFSRKTGKKTEDLCKWLKITERHMHVNTFQEQSPINYAILEKRLENKRQKSLEWLCNSLKEVPRL